MTEAQLTCVYGLPPGDLAVPPVGAVQVSPLIPGAAQLEDVTPESLSGFIIAAPPGTAERRYVLALALRALKPGGWLTAMAPKDKGGSRLAKELKAFGCEVEDRGLRHQRVSSTTRGPALTGIDEAIEAGRPRIVPQLGLWSQPGLFSWDRLDPGTALLMSVLPQLSGKGVDLGCGIGVLARAVLANPAIERLDLVDIDRRAVAAAEHNVVDARVGFHWCDARHAPDLSGLDFVVMNPPFHDGGTEDKALGQAFVRRAHDMLRKGGVLWLVANRHLPYEGVLTEKFSAVNLKAEAGGFKVYEARR